MFSGDIEIEVFLEIEVIEIDFLKEHYLKMG